MRCSTVWSPLAQTHSGDCVILNRCRYALVIPCPATITVKLGVGLIFFFSISLTSGKYSLVTRPLLESSHCCCYFVMDFWLSRCTISLFGILLKHVCRLLSQAASFASWSASSFLGFCVCACVRACARTRTCVRARDKERERERACPILSIFTNRCHCLHLQSVLLSSSHWLLTCPSSSYANLRWPHLFKHQI